MTAPVVAMQGTTIGVSRRGMLAWERIVEGGESRDDGGRGEGHDRVGRKGEEIAFAEAEEKRSRQSGRLGRRSRNSFTSSAGVTCMPQLSLDLMESFWIIGFDE
ncbi:Os12g0230900 [Oryza sativa Japonica Group]|uniref:Os12g0230900 protein n=1 Tax=Oryza sativa subsp. japonica TaxID=39947 RepID=A0A0P0Y8B4_ORYSJ|nr:Os12g0230900 [Oryza sativa Japonica Group]